MSYVHPLLAKQRSKLDPTPEQYRAAIERHGAAWNDKMQTATAKVRGLVVEVTVVTEREYHSFGEYDYHHFADWYVDGKLVAERSGIIDNRDGSGLLELPAAQVFADLTEEEAISMTDALDAVIRL